MNITSSTLCGQSISLCLVKAISNKRVFSSLSTSCTEMYISITQLDHEVYGNN